MSLDFVQLAATQTRESFIADWPYPFLVGEAALRKPRTGRTLMFESGQHGHRRRAGARQTRGRTAHPPRAQEPRHVSQHDHRRAHQEQRHRHQRRADPKFHAFFRIVDDHHELADAGSQNGTRIGETSLVPKGPAIRVHSGDVIHFAQLRFRFLDPAACWEALRTY